MAEMVTSFVGVIPVVAYRWQPYHLPHGSLRCWSLLRGSQRYYHFLICEIIIRVFSNDTDQSQSAT